MAKVHNTTEGHFDGPKAKDRNPAPAAERRSSGSLIRGSRSQVTPDPTKDVEREYGTWLKKDFGFEHILFTKTQFMCVGVSPDKRYVVAGGYDGFVYIKDMSKEKKAEDDMGKEVEGKEEGDVKKVEVEKGKEVLSLVFGQDEEGSGGRGSVIYVGTEGGKVCKVDLSRGEVVRTLTGHRSYVEGLALSPNGKTLLSWSSDRTAHVWDVTKEAAEGEDVEPIKVIEEEMAIYCVAYSPDGTKFCVGGEGGFLHVYDSTSYERLAELKGHTRDIFDIKFWG